MSLSDLTARVEAATGGDCELDAAIAQQFGELHGKHGHADEEVEIAKGYTSSLDATIGLVERLLPGWWWSVTFCYLTFDASVGPDFRSGRPEVQALCEIKRFDDGFHVARPHGNIPLALLHAVLLAKCALQQQGEQP